MMKLLTEIYTLVYTDAEVMEMLTAKIFENGRSQAVRLPKEYRFPEGTEEVLVNRIDDMVILMPKKKGWDSLFEAMGQATDDFFPDGRPVYDEQERDIEL